MFCKHVLHGGARGTRFITRTTRAPVANHVPGRDVTRMMLSRPASVGVPEPPGDAVTSRSERACLPSGFHLLVVDDNQDAAVSLAISHLLFKGRRRAASRVGVSVLSCLESIGDPSIGIWLCIKSKGPVSWNTPEGRGSAVCAAGRPISERMSRRYML